MSIKILKQKNGLYCVFSSIVEDITMYDCTMLDIMDYMLEDEKRRILLQVSDMCQKADNMTEDKKENIISLIKLNKSKKEGKRSYDFARRLLEGGKR